MPRTRCVPSGVGSTRHFALASLFDPEEGTCVIAPPRAGAGYWAGASSAVYDSARRRFYLYYRVRQPRPIRGGHCYVAESRDGQTFRTIWSATRDDFHSDSVEKASLVQVPGGGWRLYLSYVDPADQRWRVDRMDAESPEGFDPAARQPVLTAKDIQAEGVKDPYAFLVGGRHYLLLSYAPRPKAVSARRAMHATADIYNTGVSKSCSGLAASHDGVCWTWLGDVFSPSPRGWDAYAARLGAFIHQPPVFLGFYDGSETVRENYEEKTGLAISFDLRHWERVSEAGPILVSPHGSHSLRYIDPLDLGDEIFYYYEYARPDGSHELRLSRVRRAQRPRPG